MPTAAGKTTKSSKFKIVKKQPDSPAGMQGKIVIENVTPELDAGTVPIKRVIGEKVVVQADIFSSGHDYIAAHLLYRRAGENKWQRIPMRFVENDRFEEIFRIEKQANYEYTIEGWVDFFKTWQKALLKKYEASENIKIEILTGVNFLTKLIRGKKDPLTRQIKHYIAKIKAAPSTVEAVTHALSEELLTLTRNYPDPESFCTYRILEVDVERPKALTSAWYEFFPRSFGFNRRHGTFQDCQYLLPEIARMGFDVVYLPPIHPIGTTNRKGKNNAHDCLAEDPGSPWAIGNRDGGHKSIHPELGTMDDFMNFVKRAEGLGLEVAMDLAFQCSFDHPYVKQHPEWFIWRPDGTLQYAENPPQKYEDVLPFNFSTADQKALWEELKSIVEFWIKRGIKIFCADNPDTKPFAFWKWLLAQIKTEYPDVIFLSAAFTRPKVMKQLAKIGFSQSMTYFPWRTTKWELKQYLTELTQTPMREYFRPNFWPNTHDILPYHLQQGGTCVFITRLILAATLGSNYGIYGPAFELCNSEAIPGREEYLNSEKYELKQWDWDQNGNLKGIIARLNKIRKNNPALQTTWNLKFSDVDNENLLAYYKKSEDSSNIIMVVINLDAFHTQSGWVKVPLADFGVGFDQPYKLVDLMTGSEYIWQGEWNYVELNPYILPVHILRLQRN